MISAASAAGIALVALGMVLTPGPNMMYLASRSLSQGRRAGMVSLLGTVTGFITYLTMASFGLAGVFLTARWLYWTVKLAGAAYLLYLAWQVLRPHGTAVFETRDLPTRYAKMVVTDDQGRYVVPDLPKAKYKVWVRGYGLVDSAKVDGEPGKHLNLTAMPAPDE